MTAADTAFAGSIPARYDHSLGPLLFEPYAKIVAERASAFAPGRILETAAGTGIVTEALHCTLPEAEIVATDLNQAMLDVASRKIQSDRVRFQAADALDLPFADGEFDLVVCQFGVMFYPDKVRGNAEARRVLRNGGHYLVAIWDELDRNPVSQAISRAVAAEFPADPPRFIERAPFSYADKDRIERDLRSAGFTDIAVETVPIASRVDAHEAAYGMCCGSPLTAEIEERGPGAVERAAKAAEAALADYDGKDVPMSAILVSARK